MATRRFRARLTLAFVIVAAASAGVLALTSFVLVRQYRFRTFATHAEREARLGLIAASRPVSAANFSGLLTEYQRRGGFHAVAVDDELVFSSSPSLGREDIPDGMLGELRAGELVERTIEVDDHPYLVVGGVPTSGSAQFIFFFSREQLLDGLAELRNVLAVGWLISVGGAAVFAQAIARRTLRPVRAAADASQSLAEGLLEARIEPDSDDEFGAWAHTFNRMADALEARIDALGQAAERERRFTSDVAHELRTPLSGMVSAASLVEEQLPDLDPGSRRPLELLIDDVRRLQRLVLELLELARLDAGQADVHLEPLSLENALRSVARSWDGGTAVDVKVDDGLWAMADRSRFSLVVRNLVANARHHASGEGVEVRATRQGGNAVIEVLDRGPGIPDVDLPHIFERFYKGDRARSGGGSGLGLAIAFENARAQGGSLDACTREGGGACFRFILPAAEPPKETVGT
ncbi:MAG: HAMP domain-containing histidine kinase [Actinomycetota bacterium]|nr:HAMP domain-containing histidine kinase [Actinomycetota bacterium]